MNFMTYKGYHARVEYDAEDEIFFGRLAGIRDGVGFHAENVVDLKAAFHEAVEDYIEMCAKVGKEPQKPYSGNLMLRISPGTHRNAAKAAELAGLSLNAWTEQTLAKATEDLNG